MTTSASTSGQASKEAVQTARRMLVMQYIRQHILSRCNMPTLRDILANTHVASLCTARNDVRWLIESGRLVKTNTHPLEFTLPEIHAAARQIAEQHQRDIEGL